MTNWLPLNHMDRISHAAWLAGRLSVQLLDGRRFVFDGVDGDVLNKLIDSRRARWVLAREVESQRPPVLASWCCNNSPCMEDARYQADVAGVTFRVCMRCSRDDRFSRVAFAIVTAPAMPRAQNVGAAK